MSSTPGTVGGSVFDHGAFKRLRPHSLNGIPRLTTLASKLLDLGPELGHDAMQPADLRAEFFNGFGGDLRSLRAT
jgi:hypothetical protein